MKRDREAGLYPGMQDRTWKRHRRSDGTLELLSSDQLHLSVRERVRPVVPLEAIVGDATVTSTTTSDGEYVDLASIERDGVPHAIAVLDGTDFQTIIDGWTLTADSFEDVRAVVDDIAHRFPLGLGARRVRPLRHRGPAGFRLRHEGLVSVWESSSSVMRVFPARPLDEADATLRFALWFHDDFVSGFAVERIEHLPLHCGAARGTLGRAIGRDATGAQCAIATAGLSDSGYRYVIRLEQAATSRDEQPLFDVLRSCGWLAPPARQGFAARAVGHWVD